MNGFGTIQAILDDNNCLLHNHTIYALVPWHELCGVENKSIAGSVKRFSTMNRNDMEKISRGINAKYLLGILNSRYGLMLLNAVRGGDFHILPEHLRSIPIPSATSAQQAPIVALVDRIMAAKKKDSNADTSELESEIDQLVYKLYGLTDDEIAIVEGRDESKQEPQGETARRPAASLRRRIQSPAPAASDSTDDEVLE